MYASTLQRGENLKFKTNVQILDPESKYKVINNNFFGLLCPYPVVHTASYKGADKKVKKMRKLWYFREFFYKLHYVC